MGKNKKIVRVVCLALAALMVLTLAVPLVFAYAETPAEALERLRKEMEEIKNSISEAQAAREKTEDLRTYYLEQANNLKQQIAAIKEDIALQQQSIALKNAEVAEKAASVEYNQTLFEQRLKGMYEMSRQSSLATLLGIADFSQMLRFAENLQCITESDTQLVNDLKAQQEALEAERTELEAQLQALADREQELNDAIAGYAASIQQADASISALEATEAAQEEALAEKQKKYAETLEEWRQWTASDDVDFEYNGDGFAWPIPGYTTLSSDFGSGRWIYGKWDIHRGMDIPAPAGTAIYAAADGVVSTNNHWTYGISVKISHGSSLATIYGHMSQRLVNDGDYVVQGQLIGRVGSTGNSTGNHLHFEANLNGQAVSPRPYLGPPWG